MFKLVSIAAVSLILSPVTAGAQSFERLLAATDPSLAASFSAALKAAPAVKAVPAPANIETKAAFPTEDYVPYTRGGVYTYDYTSSEFTGTKALRIEYGAYSETDRAVTVTLTVFNKNKPWVTTFKVSQGANGVQAGGSPIGGARLEMPTPVVYNQSWDEAGYHNRVAAINTTATVPAGSYKNCVRIISRAETGSINRYYAPGVGLVMEQSITEDKQESISLVSFQLK